MTDERREVFVSVDVETSGQSPSSGSLLSIGACLVDDPQVALYLELQPLPTHGWDDAAEQVHGLSRDHLEREGLEPADAMAQFEVWLGSAASGARPVFVGFNAPFDWMFVADYFWRYLGRNPFGISALDLKSYYMAHVNTDLWDSTRRASIEKMIGEETEHSHNALQDAVEQAALARLLFRNQPGRFDPI